MRLWIIVNTFAGSSTRRRTCSGPASKPRPSSAGRSASAGHDLGPGRCRSTPAGCSFRRRTAASSIPGDVRRPRAHPRANSRRPGRPPGGGVTINFLFRGDEPLELTVYTPQTVPLRRPAAATNPRALRRRARRSGGGNYNAYWRQLRAEDNQPPLVPTYLTAMLAQRLGLEPPLVERLQDAAGATTPRHAVAGAAARHGAAAARHAARDDARPRRLRRSRSNLPLPAAAGLVAAGAAGRICPDARSSRWPCTCRTSGSTSASASSRTTCGSTTCSKNTAATSAAW